MPSYLSPGVYVEEVDKGTKPIEAVGTAVAAFVGFTEKAEMVHNGETISLTGKPTLVTNWSQYVQSFGGFQNGIYTPDAVYGYFATGGGRCYIVSLKSVSKPSEPGMAIPAEAVVPGGEDKKTDILNFIAKEGGPKGNSIRVEVKPAKAPAPAADDGGAAGGSSVVTNGGGSSFFNLVISVAGKVEERFDNLTMSKGERNVATVLKTESKLVEVKLMTKAELAPAPDVYPLVGGHVKTKQITASDYQGDTAQRVGIGGLEAFDDVTMLCVPDLMASYKAGEIDLKGVQAVQQMVIDFCESVKYCFAILDAPPGLLPQQAKEWRLSANYDSSRAAVYYPWIEIADQTGSNGRTRTVPPCGHMAGIYARTDETRGVHKAPANEVVRGALGLEIQITKGEHDELNPIGVNAIRAFPGRGIRVWGARTLSSDPSWKYINVRRLFNMIERSIENGTQWVVFEPNDENLWARVRRDISAFLKLTWRSGALFGTTPEQAFYVKCDAETNPLEVRDVGQLIVQVGLAPVKPAEFVIFRISQWAGPSSE
jgi:phage tail sheath protein FI